VKRLLFVPITAALVAAGSMLGVSPASAAPSAASCRPGVPVAFSASISPRIVHAGRPMTASYTINNCTTRTQTVVVRMFTTLPKSCGIGPGGPGVDHLVLIPNSGAGSGIGGHAPDCLGRFVDTWRVTRQGKLIAWASAAYTVIK
jgi:hypothetical protein